MKTLQEYLNEALAPVFESTNIGEIPEFRSIEDIESFFRSISGMSVDNIEKRQNSMFGFGITLYGGVWNGRHIYVTYWTQYTNTGRRANIGIWYSELNTKPRFDLILMRKSGDIHNRGTYPGGSGIDGVRFDLSDVNSDFYGSKKALDDLFGKPMPWRRGSESAVCDTINGIIDAFGITSWEMIRKK